MTKQKKKKQSRSKGVDYDSAWKDIIEELFKSFLEFFFPPINNDIDFSRKPEFLSQELRKLLKDSKVGKRVVDVLVKVHLNDGSTRCIFIHVEVQGTPDADFLERIYVYNYRIYDHYRELNEQVVSVAILTDDDKNYRPAEYYVNLWGFEHRMKIPIIKIIDFKDKKEELERSTNPMAMVVLAQLSSHEARRINVNQKYDVKLNLFKECLKKGYTKEQIRSLVKFIDWVINLPARYQEKLQKELIKIEEEQRMPYVTSFEKAGKKEGKKEQAKETARKMLEDDFSLESISKYTGLSEKEIKSLMQ